MQVKAIITGATGMVGEGVLHECLQSAEVEKVLVAVSTNYASTLEEVGKAVINSAMKGYEKQVLEVADIVEVSKR